MPSKQEIMGSEKRYKKSRSGKRKLQGNKRRNSIDLTVNISDEQSATTSCDTGSADQQGNSTSVLRLERNFASKQQIQVNTEGL